jgi:hypothetical protein
MSPRPLFGSPTSPRQALESVGARLSEWFQPQAATSGSVLLVAAIDDLPDATLSLERDRRLFSRTMQLVVEAHEPGAGPSADAALVMRARRMRRRFELEWRSPSPSHGDAARGRFVRAGLTEGARTVTSVQELVLSWSAADRSWRLRLVTLAGALIGTSPGAAVAVPLEPEDVQGLLGVLRAFRKGAKPAAG